MAPMKRKTVCQSKLKCSGAFPVCPIGNASRAGEEFSPEAAGLVIPEHRYERTPPATVSPFDTCRSHQPAC